MINTRSILIIVLLALSSLGFTQEVKYQLSSHILDITQGKPAPEVKISLAKQNIKGEFITIDEKLTDENGRIKDFLQEEKNVNHQGIYKLTYFVEPYFTKLNQSSFYPFIEVVFEIENEKHYHVPITLSPFGYSTYRGN